MIGWFKSGSIRLAQRRRGAEVKVMDENTIGTKLIEAAIEVHRELGPRLLESVYKATLAYELMSERPP